jgi:hypothetical protein
MYIYTCICICIYIYVYTYIYVYIKKGFNRLTIHGNNTMYIYVIYNSYNAVNLPEGTAFEALVDNTNDDISCLINSSFVSALSNNLSNVDIILLSVFRIKASFLQKLYKKQILCEKKFPIHMEVVVSSLLEAFTNGPFSQG